MTLELLLNNLCELAIKNNLVNYAAAGGSIYNLNGETIKDYPFIFISPTDEIEVGENTTTYGLTIFYCDRLLESKDNDTQIYSIATDTISNFLRQVSSLDGVVDIADYSIRVFSETQKMNDSLNGAYARVRINVLNTAACAQWFDETGEPIGTYIPSTIKDVNVLDNLASKSWVKNFVAAASISGITPEEFEEILSDYVLEKNFATINGEKITNRKKFTLVDQSAYTQDIQNIYQAISGSSKVFVLNHNKTQADINAVVNAALDTESPDFPKIILYYGLDSMPEGGEYVTLRPYNSNFPMPYDEKDAYYYGILPVSEYEYSLFVVGFSLNSMDVEVHRQDYDNREFVTQSAYTQDYSALQEQVSANTSDIAALQESDSHIYILNSSSTQADIDAAVDAALNSGDTEFAKITLYYLDRAQYIPLKPYYKYRPWADYDVYYTGCFPRDNGNMRMVLLGLTRGSMEVGYREQDFNFGLLVSRSQLPTINGHDLYRGGSFSLVENNGGVTGIWSGTQADYDAIEEKNPTVLYVIK